MRERHGVKSRAEGRTWREGGNSEGCAGSGLRWTVALLVELLEGRELDRGAASGR